jgi:photosystem II stability/assembly factor-like uncharacterized protein
MGLSWDTSYASVEQSQFREIVFTHPDTGYIVKAGGPGLFLRTYDAGSTWETVVPVSGLYSVEATSLFVLDKDHIYFSIWDGISGKVVWTNDGGLTTQLAYPEVGQPSGISGIACKDEDTCIAISGFPVFFGGGEGNDGICPVYRTDSCCDEWDYSTWTWGGAQKMQFRSWELMYTFTSNYVVRTVDQFNTLDTIKVPEYPTEYFTELFFVNDSVGYLAATDWRLPDESLPSVIYRTADSGSTWVNTYLEWSPSVDSILLQSAIYNISCLTEDNCYLVSGTTLFHTSNGGVAGANELLTMPLTLHPNPATTSLIINGLSAYPNATMTTVSLNGQTVQLDFKNGQADIQHLPAGIYITRVETDDGLWQEKWVKVE